MEQRRHFAKECGRLKMPIIDGRNSRSAPKIRAAGHSHLAHSGLCSAHQAIPAGGPPVGRGAVASSQRIQLPASAIFPAIDTGQRSWTVKVWPRTQQCRQTYHRSVYQTMRYVILPSRSRLRLELADGLQHKEDEQIIYSQWPQAWYYRYSERPRHLKRR